MLSKPNKESLFRTLHSSFQPNYSSFDVEFTFYLNFTNQILVFHLAEIGDKIQLTLNLAVVQGHLKMMSLSYKPSSFSGKDMWKVNDGRTDRRRSSLVTQTLSKLNREARFQYFLIFYYFHTSWSHCVLKRGSIIHLYSKTIKNANISPKIE